MNQIITPNYNIPYVGGFCQRFVENSIGLTGIFATAHAAWEANMGNHSNQQPPSGVIVPIYFDLTNVPADHVALSLGDGRVASTTQGGAHTTAFIHPSLQNLIDTYSKPEYGNGKCTYLGYSEFIGKKRIVTEGDEMIPDKNMLDVLFLAFRGRTSNASEQAQYIGKVSYPALIDSLNRGVDRDNTFHEQQVGHVAVKDKWDQQIYTLQDQLKAAQAGKPLDQDKVTQAIKEAQEALDAAEALKG